MMEIKKEITTAIISAIVGALIGAGSIGFKNSIQLEKIKTEMASFSEKIDTVVPYLVTVGSHSADIVSIKEDIKEIKDEM